MALALARKVLSEDCLTLAGNNALTWRLTGPISHVSTLTVATLVSISVFVSVFLPVFVSVVVSVFVFILILLGSSLGQSHTYPPTHITTNMLDSLG